MRTGDPPSSRGHRERVDSRGWHHYLFYQGLHQGSYPKTPARVPLRTRGGRVAPSLPAPDTIAGTVDNVVVTATWTAARRSGIVPTMPLDFAEVEQGDGRPSPTVYESPVAARAPRFTHPAGFKCRFDRQPIDLRFTIVEHIRFSSRIILLSPPTFFRPSSAETARPFSPLGSRFPQSFWSISLSPACSVSDLSLTCRSDIQSLLWRFFFRFLILHVS